MRARILLVVVAAVAALGLATAAPRVHTVAAESEPIAAAAAIAADSATATLAAVDGTIPTVFRSRPSDLPSPFASVLVTVVTLVAALLAWWASPRRRPVRASGAPRFALVARAPPRLA